MRTGSTGGENNHAPEDIVHRYSRAQALADAELVDVSEMARRAGFVVPVAITRAAWAECVAWTGEAAKSKGPGQSETGRLRDVLFTARLAAARCSGSRCLRAVYRVPMEGREIRPRRVVLALKVHAGDEGEPVMTIMLPAEE